MTIALDRAAMVPPGIVDRRAVLFRKSPFELAEHWVLGILWPLRPSRIGALPGLWSVWLHDLAAHSHGLPDPEAMPDNPPGLAGIVHDLSPKTLLAAYRRGIYPFGHVGPLKWWSPRQRWIMPLDEFRITRRSRLRETRHTVTFDRDFEGVIAGCARRRAGHWHLTWITPCIMRAYAEAFDAGHVHSVEVWNEAGQLVGGLYGLAIGGAFVLESLFSLEAGASRFGLLALSWHLAQWNYSFVDAKITSTWKEMGFREIARGEYRSRLAQVAENPGRVGRWQVEADLPTIADWRPSQR